MTAFFSSWRGSLLIACFWGVVAVLTVIGGHPWVALLWSFIAGAGAVNAFALRDEGGDE